MDDTFSAETMQKIRTEYVGTKQTHGDCPVCHEETLTVTPAGDELNAVCGNCLRAGTTGL